MTTIVWVRLVSIYLLEQFSNGCRKLLRDADRYAYSDWVKKLVLGINQGEAKPIAPCKRDLLGALSKLQVIARSCDWFIALFGPVVIGRSNCFGFGFSTVILKPL